MWVRSRPTPLRTLRLRSSGGRNCGNYSLRKGERQAIRLMRSRMQPSLVRFAGASCGASWAVRNRRWSLMSIANVVLNSGPHGPMFIILIGLEAKSERFRPRFFVGSSLDRAEVEVPASRQRESRPCHRRIGVNSRFRSQGGRTDRPDSLKAESATPPGSHSASPVSRIVGERRNHPRQECEGAARFDNGASGARRCRRERAVSRTQHLPWRRQIGAHPPRAAAPRRQRHGREAERWPALLASKEVRRSAWRRCP